MKPWIALVATVVFALGLGLAQEIFAYRAEVEALRTQLDACRDARDTELLCCLRRDP